MLRTAQLLLQRRRALGAATAAMGHARRPQAGSTPLMLVAPAALGMMRSCLFATKAAREQGEGDGSGGSKSSGGGGGASSKGKRTLKQRLKEVSANVRLTTLSSLDR